MHFGNSGSQLSKQNPILTANQILYRFAQGICVFNPCISTTKGSREKKEIS